MARGNKSKAQIEFHKKELEKMMILLEEKKKKSLKMSQEKQLTKIDEKSSKNKAILKEIKRLKRQLKNRNHKYELEGFISEETILRRIKQLETLLVDE